MMSKLPLPDCELVNCLIVNCLGVYKIFLDELLQTIICFSGVLSQSTMLPHELMATFI